PEPAPMPDSRQTLLDRFGATGSLLCAIHCAVTPLLLAALPALGVSLWFDGSVEAVLVVFVTLLGLLSLGWSYRRHRALRALGVLATGLGALWAGLLYPPLHTEAVPHAVVMTFGGTLVGMAHLLNLR